MGRPDKSWRHGSRHLVLRPSQQPGTWGASEESFRTSQTTDGCPSRAQLETTSTGGNQLNRFSRKLQSDQPSTIQSCCKGCLSSKPCRPPGPRSFQASTEQAEGRESGKTNGIHTEDGLEPPAMEWVCYVNKYIRNSYEMRYRYGARAIRGALPCMFDPRNRRG